MKKYFLILTLLGNLGLNSSDSSSSSTPQDRLINAAYEGDLKTVQEIISSKLVSPNIKGHMGTPLLIYAISSTKEEVIDYLLDNGADATIKDTDNISPSSFAKDNALSERLIKRLINLEKMKEEVERKINEKRSKKIEDTKGEETKS